MANVKAQTKRSDLIEPELSYQIVGSLFRVFNELGPGLQEKHYQKAVSEEFRKSGIEFNEQVIVPLAFGGKEIGRYIPDFVAAKKIIVELKKGNRISRNHAVQLLSYLKILKLPLGMLAYFGCDGVTFKRIINIDYNNL
ncbi:MAG: GxxExxY protein [Patescibacteria group bacterium]